MCVVHTCHKKSQLIVFPFNRKTSFERFLHGKILDIIKRTAVIRRDEDVKVIRREEIKIP